MKFLILFVFQLKRALKVISGFSSVRAFMKDCGSLLELFSAWRRNRYRSISIPTVVTFIVSFLYVIIPFDILPDIIPLLGWVDDLAVIKLVSDALRREIGKFRIWQRWIEESAKDSTSSHS